MRNQQAPDSYREFEDIELKGDEKGLKKQLVDWCVKTSTARANLSLFDAHSDRARTGEPTPWVEVPTFYEGMSVARARVRHGERQISRIRESLRRFEEQRQYERAVEKARKAWRR